MKTLLDREDLVFNPPELGCVLYLPGLPGGDGKIYDRSPYGNHGSITGATWVRLPSGLWCLSLDGSDDFIDCGDHDIFSFTDGVGNDKAFTLEVWVRQTDATSGYFLTKFNTIGNKREWYFGTAGDDSLSVACYHYNEGVYIVRYTAGAYMTPYENMWTHVVATYDGGKVNTGLLLYVNGSVITATAGSGGSYTGMTNTSGKLCVGAQSEGAAERLKGYVALPKIHNRVLSALDIQNHYNQEKHLFGVWSR